MPNTTVLRGGPFTRREETASEAITPGHLVEFNSGSLRKHATSGGPAASMWAVEADYIGNETTDAFASGDRVPYIAAPKGTVIWAHLASGQNVARGAELMSNGAGALTAHSGTDEGALVARADEAADASSGIGAGATLRFRAQVD